MLLCSGQVTIVGKRYSLQLPRLATATLRPHIDATIAQKNTYRIPLLFERISSKVKQLQLTHA
jgi:hypothetical protein